MTFSSSEYARQQSANGLAETLVHTTEVSSLVLTMLTLQTQHIDNDSSKESLVQLSQR